MDPPTRQRSVCRTFAASLIPVIGMTLMTSCVSVREPVFAERDNELTLEASGWRLALDAQTGTIRRIEDRAGAGTLLRGGPDLWLIERRDAPELRASDLAFTHAWNPARRELTLTFDGPDARVDIACRSTADGPDWHSQVAVKQGTMLAWQFPAGLEFDVAPMNQFIFPEHLGLAFQRAFFEKGGAGQTGHSLGGAGFERVTGDRCQMRPVKDDVVGLRPGRDAEDWLPQWYRNEMARWQVLANRCPAGTHHDLSLVECEHGSWLSGYRLGGWGILFRFGGFLNSRNPRPQIASVVATLAMAYHMPPVAGAGIGVPPELAGKAPAEWGISSRRIGIVTGRATGRPGARRRLDPVHLVRELARQSWVRENGMTVQTITDPAALRQALADPRGWYALVNPWGEAFPAESVEQAGSVLDAVREYVRNGGIWWEAGGGYSFYRANVPADDVSIESNNRSFCDFLALDSAAGRWALYGVQPPDAVYVPRQSTLTATGAAEARVGRVTHRFIVYGDSNAAVALPGQRMVLGVPHRNALASYARDNQFGKGLADKAGRELSEALKRMILLKVSTKKLADGVRVAEQLPAPVIYHISNYLKGGFDREYPDHLPPNSKVGTAVDLDRVIEACQKHGHAFMPYTNPTWWCVNPKGPTFERVGDAGLSRKWDGSIYSETYGGTTTQGHAVCAWHPAIRAANDVIREQFTKQHPVAVLFQDQVGARGHRWDTNPAAPHPGAYLEGIHRIAHVDCQTVPLGTEDGHDRLINYETMFCGLSFPWLPNRPSLSRVLYEELWPRHSWRIEPLALFLAHDKVLFFHHDLGGFVRNRLDVSITLAMGYGLSWWTHTPTPSGTERDWLDRLCRLQVAIGPRCAGEPLSDFTYLAPQVIRSQWRDFEIIANLAAEPWQLDAEASIAPEGFVARGAGLEAGIFARYGGRPCENGAMWLIRESIPTGTREWIAGPEKQGR